MLAPAALVTALVVALGFVMQPDDQNSSADPAASLTPGSEGTSSEGAAPQGGSDDGDTSAETEPAGGADGSDASGKPAGADGGNRPGDKSDPATPEKIQPLTGPRIVLDPKPKFKTIESASFTISSFNVLGDSHTVRGGNKAGRWASSGVRTGYALAALGRHGVDVVGLQEFQAPQFRNFNGRAGGTWAVYPGMSAGYNGVENSIAWRKDTFTAVESSTIAIPYFGGQAKLMPYVLLEHNATRRQVWVANFHNPADTPSHGNNFRWRRAATQKQIALANELGSDGTPVFFTGDFNERAEYFCPITGNTELKAANGGSTGSSCSPPGGMQVDWIFGSDSVEFTNYRADDSEQIDRASDHPLIAAEATLPEKKVRIRQ